MKSATFYHAGCPVCVSAEQHILDVLDHQRVDLEVVHLGENTAAISTAESLGVVSVPALVLDGNVLHLNFGASMQDLKGDES